MIQPTGRIDIVEIGHESHPASTTGPGNDGTRALPRGRTTAAPRREVLTEHYRRAHPEALGLSAR
jgi:hypothetical protein